MHNAGGISSDGFISDSENNNGSSPCAHLPAFIHTALPIHGAKHAASLRSVDAASVLLVAFCITHATFPQRHRQE